MSKIEEMANSTYFLQQHSGWLTDEELGDVEYGIKVRREAFVKGAKAVLEEIEKAYYKGGAVEVVELIEELKKK